MIDEDTRPDASLEGLDDLDGPIDEAWRQAILKLQLRTQARAAKEKHSQKAAPLKRPRLTYAESKELIRQPFKRYKHLVGQHSQKRHGQRGGAAESARPDVPDIVGALTRGVKLGSAAQTSLHDQVVYMESRIAAHDPRRASLASRSAVSKMYSTVRRTLDSLGFRKARPPMSEHASHLEIHKNLKQDLSSLAEIVRSGKNARGGRIPETDMVDIRRSLEKLIK